MPHLRPSTYMAIAAGIAAVALAPLANAQSTAVHKTTLQDQAFPAPLHSVTVQTVIDPKGEVGAHTHPGLELAYVVSGEGRVTIAGKPSEALHQGSSFAVSAGQVHSVLNLASRPMILVSTYVVDPAKPIATPAK